MGYREIFDRIDKGDLGGIFIFHGPEDYVKDRALEALKARIVPEGMEDLNYHYLEGERANAADIRRAAETLPFLAERRLVVVRDYPMICQSSRGSGLDTRQETAELELLVRRFPETTCLVFLQRAAADREKAAWKLLSGKAVTAEFARLTEDELTAQLGKIAKRAGCSVSRDAARFLLQYCGDDLEALSHEMEKACAHAGAGGSVTRGDIETVCVQSQESRIFQVIDSLYAGQGGEAMPRLRAMTEDGDDTMALLSLIERQARLMAAAKAAGRGADARALSGQLGVKPFVMESAARQASRWTGADLAEVISMCADADRSIKQGLANEQAAVEQVAMKLVLMAGANRPREAASFH